MDFNPPFQISCTYGTIALIGNLFPFFEYVNIFFYPAEQTNTPATHFSGYMLFIFNSLER